MPFVLRDCDLEPAAVIIGRVITEDGEPVPYARVGLSGGTGTYVGTNTETEADGFFQFEAMPITSDLWIAASKNDLTSGAIELETESQNLLNLEITVRPGASIEGIVVDESGAPVPGAHVHASVIGARNGGGSAEADGQGHFVLNRLGGGEHLLIAMRDDKPYTIYGDRDTRDRITLALGDHITDYTLVLKDGGTIAGVVVDPKGEPISGVNVWGSTDMLTEADGRFEMSGFFVDGGQLSFSKEGFIQQTIPQIPVGTMDLVVTLVPSTVVRGTLIDASTGEPVTSAALSVQAHWDGYSLTTNSLGFMRAQAWANGEFEVFSDTVGAGYLIAKADGYEIRSIPITIEVGSELAPITVELEPSTPLTVHVVDPSGNPVAGASVFQGRVAEGAWTGNNDKEGVTDASGTLELATYLADGGTICAFHGTWGVGRTVLTGNENGDVTVALTGAAPITGTVTLGGAPTAEVRVFVNNANRDWVEGWSTQTAPDGRYRIEAAPVGTVTFFAQHRYGADRGGFWTSEFSITIHGDQENTYDADLAVGPVAMDIDMGFLGPRVTQLQAKIVQPAQAPGHFNTAHLGSGTLVHFEGLHPGPAELSATAHDSSGLPITWGPITIEIPAAPEGPLVVGGS